MSVEDVLLIYVGLSDQKHGDQQNYGWWIKIYQRIDSHDFQSFTNRFGENVSSGMLEIHGWLAPEKAQVTIPKLIANFLPPVNLHELYRK